MSKAEWFLGAGLVVVGAGFVFAARRSAEIQERVVDLETKFRRIEKPAPGPSAGPQTDPELSRRVQQLQEETGRILDRLKALESSRPAAEPRPGNAAAGAGSAPGPDAKAESPSSGLQALLTPENQRILLEAIDFAEAERRRRETNRWIQENPDKGWEFVTKHVGLDDAQNRNVRPILAEHFKQLDALRERLRKTPEADRPAVDQEIDGLRQRTLETMQALLTQEQVGKMQEVFKMEEQSRGGGARSGVATPR